MDPQAKDYGIPTIDSVSIQALADSAVINVFARDNGRITRYEWRTMGSTIWNSHYDSLLMIPYTGNRSWDIEIRVVDNTGCISAITTSANTPPILSLVASRSLLHFTDSTLLIPSFVDAEDQENPDSIWWDLDGNGSFETSKNDFAYHLLRVQSSAEARKQISVCSRDRFGAFDTAQVTLLLASDSILDDRDGNLYATALFGSQVWMAENLRMESIYSLCYFNEAANCQSAGKWYTAEVAYESASICPAGWRIPTSQDLDTLLSQCPNGAKDLMSTASGGTNWSGLNVKPFGERQGQLWAGWDSFASFWLLWPNDVHPSGIEPSGFSLRFNDFTIEKSTRYLSSYGLSVRCIRNLSSIGS